MEDRHCARNAGGADEDVGGSVDAGAFERDRRGSRGLLHRDFAGQVEEIEGVDVKKHQGRVDADVAERRAAMCGWDGGSSLFQVWC